MLVLFPLLTTSCRSIMRGMWRFMYPVCDVLPKARGKRAHTGYIKHHIPREMLLQQIYLVDILNHIAK